MAGGLIIIAAQCSSWVWISRSTMGRSRERPYGDLHWPQVVEGNTLNAHTAILRRLAHMIGAHWIVEQPASNLFFTTKDAIIPGLC